MIAAAFLPKRPLIAARIASAGSPNADDRMPRARMFLPAGAPDSRAAAANGTAMNLAFSPAGGASFS